MSLSSTLVSPPQEPTVVSVIIPTYNRLPLLRQAVESVLAQTYSAWELIIADDGSTDGTRTYLEALERSDGRIRALLLEHAGSMTVMRTAGIEAMRGTWFALLDSDDLWHAEKLAIQMRELDSHPECGWSYTGYKHFGDDGQTVAPRTGALPAPMSGWIAEHLIMFRVAPNPPTLVVRRSLFDEVGGFDQTLHMRSDYDLVLRLAVRSKACAVTQELTLAREHPTRSSNSFPVLNQFEENERVFHKAWLNAPTPRLRALCAEQRAAQYVSMARVLRHDGRRSTALGALARAFLVAPRSTDVRRILRILRTRLAGVRRQGTASVS